MKLLQGILAISFAALAVVPPSTATTAEPVAPAAPVIELADDQFGNILATRAHRALYFWNVEKRDFKVHCTGECAKAWPPLLVRSKAVAKRIPGIKGTFGVIKRPDGRLQVTWNRLPVYTYAHERPDQVLCDNVNGWFVVRL